MANQEQFGLLKQGREVWNTWREQHPSLRPDLSGANLSGANLWGANLTRADLRSRQRIILSTEVARGKMV